VNRTWLGLYDQEKMLRQAWTNSDGEYSFEPVEAALGEYVIQVLPKKVELQDQRLRVVVENWGVTKAPVELWEEKPGVIIEGYVRAQDTRQPLEGVWLGAYSGRQCAGYTTSEADGYYLITTRGEGDHYRLAVRPKKSGYRPADKDLATRGQPRMVEDIYLPPLAPGEKEESAEVIFSIRGRLLAEGSNFSAGLAEVALKKGRTTLASALSEPDGRFVLEGVTGKPGDYQIEVVPDSWALKKTLHPLHLKGVDIKGLSVEVKSRVGLPLTRTTLTGEVFSAGGGRGVGRVRVWLFFQGEEIINELTNDFGRYELIDLLLPVSKVRLVFQPYFTVFSPLVIQRKITREPVHSDQVLLPALELTPVESLTLSGDILTPWDNRLEQAEIRLLMDQHPVGYLKATAGQYNWQIYLPEGTYQMEVRDPHGLFHLKGKELEVTGSGQKRMDLEVPLASGLGLKAGALILASIAVFWIGWRVQKALKPQ
jgi:hypothetical protein